MEFVEKIFTLHLGAVAEIVFLLILVFAWAKQTDKESRFLQEILREMKSGRDGEDPDRVMIPAIVLMRYHEEIAERTPLLEMGAFKRFPVRLWLDWAVKERMENLLSLFAKEDDKEKRMAILQKIGLLCGRFSSIFWEHGGIDKDTKNFVARILGITTPTTPDAPDS